ncbi:helix-turn-helix transcriptional regulator [Azonexus hydrophilus]|uniref:helix-turn-helix transcriptional regulator n=1 Tax=Azonexus hydrophilus TaxID=418702 RepID=UPI002491E00A|nr:WYL domain-containing protein [Azonexus hydrophilus]
MAAPRSPALETALVLIDILRCIPRQRFITSSQILEHLHARGYTLSLRSLQRHLDVLVHHFGLDCDTRGKPYGYRWPAQAQGLMLPLLTPSEALLLQLARSELAHILPARALKTLAPLFASARFELARQRTPQCEQRWLHKVRRIPDNQPLLPPRLSPGVFEAVSEALYLEHKLFICYRNARGKLQRAVICPLALVQQGVRLYLVCRFDGYDNERILALPRIIEARSTGEGFAWPKDFDLARYDAEGHFGISRGRWIKLEFEIDAAAGRHLVESPLSADQRVVERDGVLAISATVRETELLHRWLRGWGEKIAALRIEEVAVGHEPTQGGQHRNG